MLEIIFYKTISGKCPVEEFLDALTSKQSQKVTWVLRLLEELPTIPSKYFKKLVNIDDLWEVRITFGSDTFRLLGFFDDTSLVVLCHAFQKKTQKISHQAIRIAKKRKKDYFKRRNSNE
jgi:phage-related protein